MARLLLKLCPSTWVTSDDQLPTTASPDADDEARNTAREDLAKTLETALRDIVASEEFRSRLPKPPPAPEFVARLAAPSSPGKFKLSHEPIGIATDPFEQNPREVRLRNQPVMWFRLMPTTAPGRTWSIQELEFAATRSGRFLNPMTRNWRGYDFLRSHEVFGIYAHFDEPETAQAVVFVFKTGEIWSIDAYQLRAGDNDHRKFIPNIESELCRSLDEYGEFLERLGIKPPFQWIAGMEDVKGRGVHGPGSIFLGPRGKCLLEVVQHTGFYSPSEPAAKTLEPFFALLFESCGEHRAKK